VFLSDLSVRRFRTGSILRAGQDRFLARHGPSLRGTVVELGAEDRYGHRRFLPHAAPYLPTNIDGSGAAVVDVTAMGFADASIDGAVCASVLEHVRDIEAAFRELARVIRPGGRLLVVIPFCFPIHDRQDYWRVTAQALRELVADDFDVEELAHLGGKVSVVAALLQRPVGRYERRDLVFKAFGAAFVAVAGRFDQIDDTPLGWGLVARRR
jgi:SAM-dependent methyltransferase